MSNQNNKTSPSRLLSGQVVSNSGDKSVVVLIVNHIKHPLYGKIIKQMSKYHAHDELNQYKKGDKVTIKETKRYSKTKSWAVCSN